MNRRAAFEVVDRFERAVAEFTGARFAVAVDSCTNAIFLALRWARPKEVLLPAHTYVGVVQAARRAGYEPGFYESHWSGSYPINGCIVDSAKRFERGMYQAGTLTCVSFQAGKILPIGRGGAILCDDPRANNWLRKARLDGRTEGADYKANTYMAEGWHCYMTPPDAARGLWLLTYLEDDDQADWTEYPDLSQATWT